MKDVLADKGVAYEVARAAAPSTAPRSTSRSSTPSAARGSEPPCSSTSTCPSASTSPSWTPSPFPFPFMIRRRRRRPPSGFFGTLPATTPDRTFGRELLEPVEDPPGVSPGETDRVGRIAGVEVREKNPRRTSPERARPALIRNAVDEGLALLEKRIRRQDRRRSHSRRPRRRGPGRVRRLEREIPSSRTADRLHVTVLTNPKRLPRRPRREPPRCHGAGGTPRRRRDRGASGNMIFSRYTRLNLVCRESRFAPSSSPSTTFRPRPRTRNSLERKLLVELAGEPGSASAGEWRRSERVLRLRHQLAA